MKEIRIILFLLAFGSFQVHAQTDQKIMIVIIDGARYTETFGDPVQQYTPRMWELALEGTIINRFYNNGITYTAKAIPALWCGT